ncbi:MAG: PfkB family carbohydrate kinase, partial [Elusimicrobiota bacterium]
MSAQPPSMLVVGSVALDSVTTPEGESREALGGSAVFFSLAARLFTGVSLVGVVGRDFPDAARRMLADRGVDLSGLEAVDGETFRWVGRFGRDLNSAKTLATHLNVFEAFRPKLTQRQKECSAVFLANIDPQLQWEVLSQMRSPGLVACDTMNFWISGKRAALKELLSKVDIFFVNDEEARKLARASSTVAAART